ncbi:thioredoxin family protein [Marinicauda pacifica]|jgi:peroxiredoxin|nr:redoxin domain-containing protein [Marinicauda pacifica]GGE50038.1 thioredoxin family protein [Marinicauda pacifica]
MMTRFLTTLAAGTSLLALAGMAHADPVVGEPAPAFEASTATGEAIALSDFSGETVILEWTNHGCPYVQKHYDGQNMQELQANAASDGITWIQIISSAPGKQGHVSAEEALALNQSRGAAPAHVVLDPEGTIGRAYEAATTPHMYIIDAEGTLRYAGAIDDQPSARSSSLEGAHNYVTAALDAMEAGEPIDPDQTVAYGCNVKYPG